MSGPRRPTSPGPGPVDPAALSGDSRRDTERPPAAPEEVPLSAIEALPEPSAVPMRVPPAGRHWGRVLRWGGIALAAWAVIALGEAGWAAWRAGSVADMIPVAVGGVAGLAALWALWREYAALRRMASVESVRRALAALGDHDRPEAALAALAPVLDGLRARRAAAVADFEAAARGANDAARVLALFERDILAPIDAEARQAVQAGSLGAATATALVPHAALDGAIVLWRGAAMVRAVAALYGLRPTGLSTLRLLRELLLGGALVMGTELVGHLAITQLGEGLAARLSAATGQGLVTYYRLSRLGAATIAQCRPLEPEDDADR